MATLPPASTGPADAGVQGSTTPNGAWHITTRKLPILKSEPIDKLSDEIGIPIPELIFGDNFVSITHLPTGWTIRFNARDGLDRVSKTEEGMLQVAVADVWKKTREGQQEEVKQVVKPFDWSYSTDYKGTTEKGTSGSDWVESSQEKDPIRTDLLSKPDPILFFDAVDLYEDELGDNGIGLLSVKVRVMPERLLLLSRFFLRLDGVVLRICGIPTEWRHFLGYLRIEQKFLRSDEHLIIDKNDIHLYDNDQRSLGYWVFLKWVPLRHTNG